MEINLANDIYYKKEYAALYTDGKSEIFDFDYVKGNDKVCFRSIKRRIKSVAGVDLDEKLYDLETAYGYGGPRIESESKAFLKEAFQQYKEVCASQNIVCEFFRIHPFNSIYKYQQLFDFWALDREVVIVNVNLPIDERWSKYSKTTRNILRKTNNNLIRIQKRDELDDFCSLYEKTMEKNNASDFFYFDRAYFEKLSLIKGVELLSVKLGADLVSAGFFMYGDDIAHYHLSANDSDFSRANGNYELLDYAFDLAKQKKCSWFMLGGGRTTDENDSLLRFKAKFSDQLMPFYIGGLDFLPDVKARLNAIWEKEKGIKCQKLFQPYRV